MIQPNYCCPLCGTLSQLVISERQAFCTGGDDCPVLMFDPSLPDGGLSNARSVDLRMDEG